MRKGDLDGVYHLLGHQCGYQVRRVEKVLPSCFQIHYVGQRMYCQPPHDEAYSQFGLLILHPHDARKRLGLFATDGVCRIPELVLKNMERKQYTIELAAYTLESPIAIAEKILEILRCRDGGMQRKPALCSECR